MTHTTLKRFPWYLTMKCHYLCKLALYRTHFWQRECQGIPIMKFDRVDSAEKGLLIGKLMNEKFESARVSWYEPKELRGHFPNWVSTRGKLLIVDVSKLAQGWSCAGQEATFTLCINKVLVWVDKEMCGIFVLDARSPWTKKKKAQRSVQFGHTKEYFDPVFWWNVRTAYRVT